MRSTGKRLKLLDLPGCTDSSLRAAAMSVAFRQQHPLWTPREIQGPPPFKINSSRMQSWGRVKESQPTSDEKALFVALLLSQEGTAFDSHRHVLCDCFSSKVFFYVWRGKEITRLKHAQGNNVRSFDCRGCTSESVWRKQLLLNPTQPRLCRNELLDPQLATQTSIWKLPHLYHISLARQIIRRRQISYANLV